MIGHHVLHSGYRARYSPKTFGKGLKNRVRDWLDWILPEAWTYEHNHLHHRNLGELGDPDLVERNFMDIRSLPWTPINTISKYV
jgi:fatty acid desaturase